MVLLAGLLVSLVGLVVYDLVQTQHAILRNFPIIGHFRYILESIGPELRQYIVTDNDEERPFSRDQRRWVYSSAKKQNNYFGFGTDNDLEGTPNTLIIKQATFPWHPKGDAHPDEREHLPAAKVTPQIAAIRGITMGQHCLSPSYHTAFSDVDSLLDRVKGTDGTAPRPWSSPTMCRCPSRLASPVSTGSSPSAVSPIAGSGWGRGA